ncbi:MAG: YdcF family protein [Defluviitaleaceae bacterium]|nr:YdcF family protein [Defluviitaleaceae bacterium]
MRIAILCITALFLIASVRMAFFNGVSNNNTIFLAGISIVVGLYGVYYNKLKHFKALTAVIVAVFFVFIGMSAFLAVYGSRPSVTYTENVVLVLGGGVRDGEVQSSLRRRLDMAVEYHNQNPTAMMIVTGAAAYREPFSEAEAMARYLISQGIPENQIIREEYAHSTFTNMTLSRILFDTYLVQYGVYYENPTAVIITNDFHMFRSVRFAQGVGFNALAYPARTPWYTVPFNYSREVAAVFKMWLIGR